MPHYNFSEDSFEEICEMSEEIGAHLNEKYERNERGEYHSYEAAKAQFSPDLLQEADRFVYQMLRDLKIDVVQCRYDGGSDEGFAHFEYAIQHDQSLGIKVLCPQLANTKIGEAPARALFGYEMNLTPQDRVREALDSFAYALAARLLGDGFGTGECSMYGAFRADLRSGEIVDDPATEEQA